MKQIILAIAAMLLPLTMSAQQLPTYLDKSKNIESRVEDALSRMTLDEKIAVIHAQSKFSSAGVKRLGIPEFWTDDGPMGVRPDVLWDEGEQAGQTNASCLALPARTCLAASWNPSLAYSFGKALGEEGRYRKKNMILGPGVNIIRSPLGGRNFEYFSEDPYLVSLMCVPYIKGLQSNNVSACVKHYALNNSEEYRNEVNVKISDRALHEIYLPAFHAAVTKGNVWAVMGAYNLYNNQHNCYNEILVNKILKGDWKFDGVLVSDWGGAHNTMEAIRGGLDMEFGSWTNGLSTGASNAYDNYYLANAYKKLILEGKVSTKELDDKVRRVLRVIFRTSMSSNHSYGSLCAESHYATARAVADEGIVLLQNRGNVLPVNLSKAKTILVVGENAIKMMTVGGGSSSLKVQREISPLNGLKAALSEMAPNVKVEYERGYVGDTTGEYNGVKTGQDLKDSRSAAQLISDAVEKAKKADYVIMFGGLNKSDYQDCEGHDRKSYELPYGQDDVIKALAAANKNFVYVNISGNPVAMPWSAKVPAIVQGWFLGSEMGNALADVLLGKVNPSGKLPYTWYAKLNDCGAHALDAWHGTWRPDHKIIDEEYKEGIYVGYRWTDKQHLKPTFAFGHGLSYTSFKLSNVRPSATTMTPSDSVSFTVNVKNTGKRDGAETVQLYIHTAKPTIDRPYKELKGFRKVFLKAGESRDVTITIGRDALSYWDETSNGWKAEPGAYVALLGTSSDNLPLQAKFELK